MESMTRNAPAVKKTKKRPSRRLKFLNGLKTRSIGSASAKLVLIHVLLTCNERDARLQCILEVQTLASWTGLSARTVTRATEFLQKHGWIEKVERKTWTNKFKRRQVANAYIINEFRLDERERDWKPTDLDRAPE